MSGSSSGVDVVAQLRHDLRTPVNQILGYSELLEEDVVADGSAQYVPDLKKVQTAARNLLAIITERVNAEWLGGAVDAVVGEVAAAGSTDPVAGSGRGGDESGRGGDEEVRFRGRVLAVDDNESNLSVLSRRLERHGLEVETAGDGRAALELVRSRSYDLVLLDILMPVMDGYQALQEIKADPVTRHIPVIMISALDELESVIRCIESGAEDYLPKPFNPTLLRARIGACLEKKALRDAEQQHLRTIEETQKRLDGELAEAAHYVRSIIPPPSDGPIPIDWKYRPSTELGGDAFGYHWIDDGHFAMYLLDVCGHGVGASLLSVTAINLIRTSSLLHTDFRDPAAVLSALNLALPMERQNDMYFTIWYGVYEVATRTLRHSSGGHPPALLVVAGEDGEARCERLRAPGMVIGAMEDAVYQSHCCVVPEGAQLFVLCDGCFEVNHPDGRMLEFDEFAEFMRVQGTAADGLDRLEAWITGMHGEGPLDDDFSIVRFKL